MNLKFNIGQLDKMIRLIIAIVICLTISLGIIKDTLPIIILNIIAAILIMTSVIDYCPIYALLRISTK